MLILIIVIVGLSLLILGHEAGHFFAAKFFGLKVDEFGIGFPPRVAAWKRGETEYSVNWLPFGGFVRIAGERGEFEMVRPSADMTLEGPLYRNAHATAKSRLLYAQPAWKKSIIMLAGVAINFLLGWLFLSLILMVGAPQALVIADVEPGSPAAQAGIMPGDIVAHYNTSQPFIDFINLHRGEPITMSVIRSNKENDITLTPRKVTAANQGAIGVALSEAGTEREGFIPAIRDGFLSAGIIAGMVLFTFFNLVQQLLAHATLLPGVVGPVGIFGIAEETGKIGMIYLLQLLGVISINLAIVNLIPFPALDGGRFIMAIVEKIKGSPISYKVEAWINGLGFAFLLGLMVLLTVRDVSGLL